MGHYAAALSLLDQRERRLNEDVERAEQDLKAAKLMLETCKRQRALYERLEHEVTDEHQREDD